MTKPVINVTIPVLNEEKVLASSIHQLTGFLKKRLRYEWEVVIVDNGSTDSTPDIARDLARQEKSVQLIRLEEKGRGRALKTAWGRSSAGILTYMDVDLSTSLESFPALVDAIACQGFDIGVGSRLLKPELTKRGFKRELISRCYNGLIKLMFKTKFSDAQCGFKAISRSAAKELLPLIEDNNWFFDSELLILAERRKYQIFDLPVPWVDDPDSRVKILRTAVEDLRGLYRLKRGCKGMDYSADKVDFVEK